MIGITTQELPSILYKIYHKIAFLETVSKYVVNKPFHFDLFFSIIEFVTG